MLLTHALALSASQFVHKKKSQRIHTSMDSAGLELTKLTYTRLEDNLIRHRGDRLYIHIPRLSRENREEALYTCQLSVRASHSRIYLFDNAAATRDRSPLISFLLARGYANQSRRQHSGNPHIFSSTKYLVSKPAPGPTSWNTASLDTPTPPIDRSLHKMKYIYNIYIYVYVLCFQLYPRLCQAAM